MPDAIDFDRIPIEDRATIVQIAYRASGALRRSGYAINSDLTRRMALDVANAHISGRPLDLERLFQAPEAELVSDVLGIQHSIDRQTGKLGGFYPRYAAR